MGATPTRLTSIAAHFLRAADGGELLDALDALVKCLGVQSPLGGGAN